MTVQVLAAKVPAQVAVWVEQEARVEAGWADRLQQARAEIVFARVAGQQPLTLLDSLVIQETVQNVVRK